jgi:hypothetical protein
VAALLAAAASLRRATTATSPWRPGAVSRPASGRHVGAGQLDASVAGGSTGWLKFELGVASDRIVLTNGTLNLGTGFDLDDFTFTDAGGFGAGSYTLFESNSLIVGTLGTNVSGTVLGFEASLEFADGGTDLVLNVVPEPGASVALLGGFVTLLGLQRFRRRRQRISP